MEHVGRGFREPARAGEVCCETPAGWKFGAQKVAKESASSCYVVRTDNEHGVLAMERANIARLLLVRLGAQGSILSWQLVPKEVEPENICSSKEALVPAEAREDYLFA